MSQIKAPNVRNDINITPLQQMLSSGTGAILTSVFVTPLDVVKIRLQAQQKHFTKHKCFLYCNGLMDHLCFCINGNGSGNAGGITKIEEWYKRPGHFSGTLDAFVKIARYEGIASLWSGLPPTLVMALPATVAYFTMYDQIRAGMSKLSSQPQHPSWAPMVAGASARTLTATVISPLELIRTKMQSKKLSYLEIGNNIKSLVQSQGWWSLWRGLGPTLLRDVPFSAVYWSSYESLKAGFNQQHPTLSFSFFAGAVSGTAASIVTIPFDVVKTHRQIELGDLEKLNKSPQIIPTYRLVINLYKTSGFNALFAGFVPRIIKVAPACAIMISSYEYGKVFFKERNFRKINV